MTLHAGWPAVSGAATFQNIRRDIAGTVAKSAANVIRKGILPIATTNLVTGTATMNVAVGAFYAVLDRNGVVYVHNDGSVNVLLTSAPGSGSRWSVVYVKQRESESPFSDGATGPVLDKVESVTSEAAARALLPAGALELAVVKVDAGSANTNAVGVTITQTVPFTAMEGGVVLVRNSTELAAWTPHDGAEAYQIDNATIQQRTGGAWRPLGVQVPTDRATLPANGPTFTAHATAPMKYWISGGLLNLSGIIINVSAGTFGTTEDLLGTLPAGSRPSVDRFVPAIATISGGATKQLAIARISSGGGVYITRSASAGVGIGDLWNILECSVPLV